MAKRIILFSGGVESTALLALADRDDIILVCNYGMGIYETYNELSVVNICSIMGFKPYFVRIEIPLINGPIIYTPVHQVHRLAAAAHLTCIYNTKVTEVWFGINSEDTVTMPFHKYDQERDIWAIHHPDVQFKFPLQDLTKAEQWKLIPDNVKPFVSYCMTHNNCGKCIKCIEFTTLVGSREVV